MRHSSFYSATKRKKSVSPKNSFIVGLFDVSQLSWCSLCRCGKLSPLAKSKSWSKSKFYCCRVNCIKRDELNSSQLRRLNQERARAWSSPANHLKMFVALIQETSRSRSSSAFYSNVELKFHLVYEIKFSIIWLRLCFRT